MFGHSPKAGLAQKKKKQAIRRLSQTETLTTYIPRGARGSGSFAAAVSGRGGAKARRSSGGQSSSQANTQDNPFLKGLPSAKAPPAPKSTAQSQNNPFLKGLQQATHSEQPLPPPSYSSFLSTSSTHASQLDSEPDPSSTGRQPPNPFLASSKQSQDKKHARVSFDPSLTAIDSNPGPARPRIPSYSEVVAAHGPTGARKQTAGGLASQQNLKALHIKGIPDELNTSEILREHFSQFGHVKLLKCFPAKKYATVEFATRQDAVKAKRAGKYLSPDHNPLTIFWHASRQSGPTTTQGPKVMIQAQGQEPATTRKRTVLDQGAQIIVVDDVPLQQTAENKPKKSSVWSRLGPEKGTTEPPVKNDGDETWAPEDPLGNEQEQEVDEGVYEGPGFLKELGNKVTGDEMDTIARTAAHPYFLRSLMQHEAHDGPSTPVQTLTAVTPPSSVSQTQTPVTQNQTPDPQHTLPDSRQLYTIPRPNIPLLPHSRASTAGECYEALNARDQEIRKGTVKQTVLSEARAIVGTCPDMCTEKERYRREDTRRLSWFEVSGKSATGKPRVDHARAIKEYSGSAADKEEPLPHDLRPLSVLQMTMDYLLTRVMDDYQERTADWYDFVWNRTRAIRKDITLQHLCTVQSTELTEKCARFHILCSHLLCEEDILVFDPKLNNENLNKCLLSLKEFYRDLRAEKNIYCPNEAEFCCYDILLHLTEGNVLNLASQYSDAVRDTPEVRFAVSVALAYDSNNYVKFFKLVRSTTYLNACILHRYFELVRTRALKVLNRSLTVQKKPTSFSLSDLCRILGFESNEKAAEFCEVNFGLSVPSPRTSVHLVRGALDQGEEKVPIRRSHHLVEVKNQRQLGEVVNGAPLPPLFKHVPFSSFSPEGQLPTRPVSPTFTPPPKPSYTTEELKTAVESVVCEGVSVSVEEVIRECVTEEESLVSEVNTLVCGSILDGLLDEVVTAEAREAVQKIIMEAREVKAIKDEIADSAVTEAIETVVAVEVRDIIQTLHWDCMVTAQATEAAAVHLTEELVEVCMREGVRSVAIETLHQVKQEKREKLEALRQQFLLQRTLKYWQRWAQALKVREHVRQCASDIPPLPPMMSLPWQLDVLCPLEKRRKVEVTTCEDTAEKLEESKKEREKRRQEFYAPVDLPSVLKDVLLAYHTPSQPHTPHIHWKLAFIYPPQHTLSTQDTHTLHWLHRKLKSDTSTDSTPSQDSEQLSLSSTPAQVGMASLWGNQATRRLNIAVQGVCSNWREGSRGCSGVMVYVPLPQGQSIETFLSGVFTMLGVLRKAHRSSAKLPLLLAYPRQLEENHLAAWISLRRALENYCQQPDSQWSSINCLRLDIPSYVPTSPIQEETQLCSSLQWLVEHSPPPPSLIHAPLRDFIEKGLLNLFVPLVVSDSSARDKACLPSQPPAPVISLYNYILDHLAAIATARELVTLEWPVPEFAAQKFTHGSLPPIYWNNPSYFAELRQCIEGLQLPSPPAIDSEWYEDDWSTQCTQCLEYVSSVPQQGSQLDSVTLLSRIKALLHHHHHVFECGDSNQSECSVPWAHVILACIEYKLSCLNSDLWASCFHENQHKFSVPTSWLRAEAETSLATAAQVTDIQSPMKKRRRRHRSDPPHLNMVTSTPVSSHYPSASSTPWAPAPASVGVSPFQGVAERQGAVEDELKEKLKLLQREKAHSQRFEDQLQQWMNAPYTTSTDSVVRVNPGAVHSVDHTHKQSSLTDKLKELQAGIRAAKWKEKEDALYLRSISNS